jgi:hypothetical protein
MKARWALVNLAVLSLTGYCAAQCAPGWGDCLEFDNASDFSGTTATSRANAVAFNVDGNGGTAANFALATEGSTGYLIMDNTVGTLTQNKLRLETSTPLVTNADGWTVEMRFRYDRNWAGGNFKNDGSFNKAFQLRVRDGTANLEGGIGNSDGPDVVTVRGFTSWTWNGGGTLVEPTSDWHVYRYVCDGAAGNISLYVDGTFVGTGNGLSTSTGNSFGWHSGTAAKGKVHIDYIRWKQGQDVPTASGLVIPALKNRRFDNIHDENGDTGVGGNQTVAFWEIQNLPAIDDIVNGVEVTWTKQYLRSEPYAYALRWMQGEPHHAAVKQAVLGVGANRKVVFTGLMLAYTAACTPIEGRVGVDPEGSGCDPLAPSIVWSPWTELYDDTGCAPFGYLTLTTGSVVTGASGDICVFIEGKGDVSPGTDQSTFIDGSDLLICNQPPQDADGDGDVDLSDFGTFQSCFNGPNRPYAGTDPKCTCFDTEPTLVGDGDVDLADFGTFQACFNGPNRPPACE